MTMRLKLFYWLLGKEKHENHKFGSSEIGIVLNLKAQCGEDEHVTLINGVPAIVPNSSWSLKGGVKWLCKNFLLTR